MLKQAAKSKILKWFPPGTDSSKNYNDFKEEDYIEVYNSVKADIPFKKPNQNISLFLFLYAACLKFDRWVAPTPIILKHGFCEQFNIFVNALIKSEGGESDNTKIFQLRIIKNEIFSKIDGVYYDNISHELLDTFNSKLKCLSPPIHQSKINEYEDELFKINAILDGIKNRTLCTKIISRIPYILHLRPISIDFIWNDIPVTVDLFPEFYKHPSTFLSFEPESQPEGPTRWQTGITHINIQFDALLNTDAQVDELLSFPSHNRPFTTWSRDFEILFEIIHNLSWEIRLNHEGEKQWVPAPRDIPEAEIEICSAYNPRIFYKKKASPGVLTKGFKPVKAPLLLEVDNIYPPEWHARCRWISVSYLQLGETNEALFWLNVGIESLFKERFREISSQIDRNDLEDELESGKVYWDEANEIIVKQFPELEGIIKWPEAGSYVSIYRKLKYLYKIIEMQETINDLLSKYSKISKHRNALFHGSNEKRISVKVVNDALNAFDWIDENHKIKA